MLDGTCSINPFIIKKKAKLDVLGLASSFFDPSADADAAAAAAAAAFGLETTMVKMPSAFFRTEAA